MSAPFKIVLPSKATSVKLGSGLLALCTVLLLTGYTPDFLTHFQTSIGYKQVTGYLLLILMSFLIALLAIKRRLKTTQAMVQLLGYHQVAGLIMLGVLALHAGFSLQGYLGLLSWLIAAMALIGVLLIKPIKALQRPREKSIAVSVHIALAFIAYATALVHIYFVWAYSN